MVWVNELVPREEAGSHLGVHPGCQDDSPKGLPVEQDDHLIVIHALQGFHLLSPPDGELLGLTQSGVCPAQKAQFRGEAIETSPGELPEFNLRLDH